ncbi:lytic transglycosylase domain-containing protein [uncultured Cedecea sp.]|uniref:lytic transglycosylase domain-containing protein n=1 Tax=uncultured Cedecea sp. TaxID=988762 RepID=UPI0026280452|nr:lytic transglycosylase domain-containing protein [uncultured Cedecea sp.]
MKIKRNYHYLSLLLVSSVAGASYSDCIHEAAQCFKINPLIIKAIIWQESNNRQDVINVNKNKTQDVGIMQINSIHFNTLGKLGVTEKEIRENSCANVFSGSWILSRVIENNAYSWEGIGKYHSKTPYYRDRYISKLIATILEENKIIDKIKVPYQSGIREKFSCASH